MAATGQKEPPKTLPVKDENVEDTEHEEESCGSKTIAIILKILIYVKK